MSFFKNAFSSSSLFINTVDNISKRFATKKSAGSTKNGRTSQPKYLGVKKFGGQFVIPGNIIMRQRGTKFHPGVNVGMGRDHTIYSMVVGYVKFSKEVIQGSKNRIRKYISVTPLVESTSTVQDQSQQQIITTEN